MKISALSTKRNLNRYSYGPNMSSQKQLNGNSISFTGKTIAAKKLLETLTLAQQKTKFASIPPDVKNQLTWLQIRYGLPMIDGASLKHFKQAIKYSKGLIKQANKEVAAETAILRQSKLTIEQQIPIGRKFLMEQQKAVQELTATIKNTDIKSLPLDKIEELKDKLAKAIEAEAVTKKRLFEARQEKAKIANWISQNAAFKHYSKQPPSMLIQKILHFYPEDIDTSEKMAKRFNLTDPFRHINTETIDNLAIDCVQIREPFSASYISYRDNIISMVPESHVGTVVDNSVTSITDMLSLTLPNGRDIRFPFRTRIQRNSQINGYNCSDCLVTFSKTPTSTEFIQPLIRLTDGIENYRGSMGLIHSKFRLKTVPSVLKEERTPTVKKWLD